ncbi:zinc ribbon domain-containing protein [Halopelagius fulvigenes]|uniref:Zinc ribbon domain-containing protein n=1 Tax=Halopelagius fulvigenes TaxID=1198324 RepID=A0ABD5TVN2_9EURY
MDVEVVFRLLVAAFCVVAPSVLFVGLVRGLDKLRDDRLVEQVLERMDDDDATAPTYRRAPFTAAVSDGGRTAETAGCDVCGASNPPYASYCGACLSALDGDSRAPK